MASPLRPSDDQQQPEVRPQGGPPDQNGLGKRWNDWLGDDNNRAALISFGASMLQPSWYGFGSQVGASLGAAGETMGAKQEQEIKQREQRRKEEETADKGVLRSAQAEAATAKAGAAEATARTAEDRLTNARERDTTSRLIGAQRAYNQDVKLWQQRKKDYDVFGDPKKPFDEPAPDLDSYYDNFGVARGGGRQTTSPATAPATGTSTAPGTRPSTQNTPAPPTGGTQFRGRNGQVIPQSEVEQLVKYGPAASQYFDAQYGPGTAAAVLRAYGSRMK